MVNLNTVPRHPDYPEKVWIVVEQLSDEQYRLKYDPHSGTFTRTDHLSLIYKRGFSGVYGWIGGTGTPPAPHFDVLMFTHQHSHPGEVLLGTICGMFIHKSGDHKLVAVGEGVLADMQSADISALNEADHAELMQIFPRIDEGEGWFGGEYAREYLLTHEPLHD